MVSRKVFGDARDEPVIQRACLICMDRTGSNLVSSRLNTHPEVCFYNEVFHRQFAIFQDDRVVRDRDLLAFRDRHPAAFVSQLWNGEYEPPERLKQIRTIGFKLFLNHDAEALRYVTQSGVKIIFLRRRNPLARFSSFKIAEVTDEWKALKQPKSSTKVLFNAGEFRAYVQNYKSLEMLYEMMLTRWKQPHMTVWYEDLVRNPVVWPEIAAYLGLDIDKLGPSPLLKQNPTDMLQRFKNPDVVADFVARSGSPDWWMDF